MFISVNNGLPTLTNHSDQEPYLNRQIRQFPQSAPLVEFGKANTPEVKNDKVFLTHGGAEEIRTPDPRVANAVL